MAKITREKFKTREGVFDQSTIKTLFKLSTQGFFDNHEELIPISRGKEAQVYLGRKGDDYAIIKIYNVQNCDFNRMFDYLRQDPNYREVKRSKRGVTFAWTQKEFRNLQKAHKADVHAPTPHSFFNNVLVMEPIGDDTPAPKLKDQIPKDPKAFFDKVINELKKLHKAELVHGDCSQFNILNHNEEPILIDFSQATSIENQNAQFYLKRDIKNICTFFRRIGVETDEKTVYDTITQ